MAKLFYSTSEVANIFRVNRVTIYRWVKDGKVKAYGIGKHLKIPLSEVERLLKEFGFADMVVEDGNNDPAKDGVRKKLVVAIDDDKHILMLIKELFKRKRLHELCQLKTFSDSLEAAMRIGREKPDVILLDIAMPGINGFELVGKIEKINKDVRIVIMTAYPADKLTDFSEGVKIFQCLAKPISSEELYKTIVSALN
jgi:excisionase family DNA binding protein